MGMVKPLSEIKNPKVLELGGKAYSLVVLINNGFNVPDGFVIISYAFCGYLLSHEKIYMKAYSLLHIRIY